MTQSSSVQGSRPASVCLWSNIRCLSAILEVAAPLRHFLSADTWDASRSGSLLLLAIIWPPRGIWNIFQSHRPLYSILKHTRGWTATLARPVLPIYASVVEMSVRPSIWNNDIFNSGPLSNVCPADYRRYHVLNGSDTEVAGAFEAPSPYLGKGWMASGSIQPLLCLKLSANDRPEVISIRSETENRPFDRHVYISLRLRW
jgi:hypothetical protein